MMDTVEVSQIHGVAQTEESTFQMKPTLMRALSFVVALCAQL